jgi:hypothetical protein
MITVTYGTNLTYTITPEVGYKIDDVLIDNQSVGPVTTYTFSNAKGDHSISVLFSVIPLSINVDANPGGSVSPEGTTIVNYGSEITCTFIPDYGYRINDVKIDNISAGSILSYSFKNITGNHNLSVVFKPITTYTISVSPGNGGSITPSGTVTLFEGTDQVYSIIPEEGYRIMDVLVDNKSVGPVSEYTFSNIESNHNISARFTTSIDVSVYPNPFVSDLNILIAAPGGNLFDMTIADLSGRNIYSQTIPANTVVPVNLQVTKGYYIVRIFSSGKKIATIKIVKT